MLTEKDSLPPLASPQPTRGESSPSTLRRRINAQFSIVRTSLEPPRRSWYLPCKAAADWTCALVLLLLTAPLMLLAALAIKLTSSGPAFYMQTRVGKNGRLFTIYKLRTMIHNCESLTGPRWAMPGDPRVTWVGRILRISHFDELPQLLNVLRGDMSLIGPRPERPEFLPKLHQAIREYQARLAVRPGVTGLAQVNLPADTDLDSVRNKLAYDLYYIRRLSFWLDVRILLCTVLYAVGVPFRVSRKLVGVPTGVEVQQVVHEHLNERPAGQRTASAA
jgi:lipopolysaccharide/colanic/teichoic acid biosynthesis glycosyltransferase